MNVILSIVAVRINFLVLPTVQCCISVTANHNGLRFFFAVPFCNVVLRTSLAVVTYVEDEHLHYISTVKKLDSVMRKCLVNKL